MAQLLHNTRMDSPHTSPEKTPAASRAGSRTCSPRKSGTRQRTGRQSTNRRGEGEEYSEASALSDEVKGDATHSAHFGVGLQERCHELDLQCDIVYPGAPKVTHETATDYLIATLTAPAEAK